MTSSISGESGKSIGRSHDADENISLARECPCRWNQSLKKTINDSSIFEEFSSEYAQLNTRTLVCERGEAANVLYRMKTIHIRDLTLHMGLAPKYGFNFVCCLTSSPMDIDRTYISFEQLIKLYNVLKEIYDEVTSSLMERNPDIPLGAIIVGRVEDVQKHQMELPLFLFTDFQTARHFIQNWSFIRKYAELAINEKDECEKTFTRALFVYCDNDKNVTTYHEPNVRRYFLTMMNLECNCIPNKGFMVEMALSWMEWFGFCLHFFRDLSLILEKKKIKEMSKVSFDLDNVSN